MLQSMGSQKDTTEWLNNPPHSSISKIQQPNQKSNNPIKKWAENLDISPKKT